MTDAIPAPGSPHLPPLELSASAAASPRPSKRSSVVASVTAHLRCPSPSIQLHLGASTRRLLLAALVLLQLVCAAFLLVAGQLYWFLDQDYMTYFANLLGPPEELQLRLWGGAFTAVAALHLADVTLFCVLAAGGRQWLRARLARLERAASAYKPTTGNPSASKTTAPRSLLATATALVDSVFGRRGVLGIESDYFALLYVAREVLEISSQCVQLRRSTELVPRVWLNNTYAALIVINCCTTPLIQLASRGRTAVERVACLTCDTLLCVALSVAVPLGVLVPWALRFDPTLLTFPPDVIFSDVLFMKLVREHQAFLASSLGDGLSKLFPHLATLSTIRAIREIVDEAVEPTSTATATATKATVSQAPVVAPVLPTDAPSLDDAIKTKTKKQEKETKPLMLRVLYWAAHAFFAALAIVVVVAQLVAQYGVNYDGLVGCRQLVFPWFTTKPSCAILRFSCHRHGVETPGDAAFEHLNTDTLGQLTFAHCPQFTMPRAIHRMRNLLGLTVYNATAFSWPADAALDLRTNDRLGFVIIARANVTTPFPEGLVAPLPRLLRDVELSTTNVASVPAELAEIWPPMTTFYLEHSLLTEFPDVLFRLAVDDLSLIGNRIERVPAFKENVVVHGLLALAGNPLKELPDAVAEGSGMWFFLLDDTLLPTVPRWLGEITLAAATLSNTPFCALHNSTDENVYSDGTVTCARSVHGPTGRYPIEDVTVTTPFE
ncbi:hypothetical protein PINS_up010710 [Pythium insidiosum]|nr:hypothetical protein PINS_up010710 [Pythium insidiosum]